jgi:hypothetical protein
MAFLRIEIDVDIWDKITETTRMYSWKRQAYWSSSDRYR